MFGGRLGHVAIYRMHQPLTPHSRSLIKSDGDQRICGRLPLHLLATEIRNNWFESYNIHVPMGFQIKNLLHNISIYLNRAGRLLGMPHKFHRPPWDR